MLRIFLFGHFRIYIDDQPQKSSALPKTIPLFAYLLLHGAEPVSRNRLAFTLWPDSSESEARANLRRHLHDLRRILPPTLDDSPWIVADFNTLRWNPNTEFWLDVHEFERLSVASPPDAQRIAATVSLYTGDLLEELYEDWIFFERERLRNRFFENLAYLIQFHRGRLEHSQAIAYAQQALVYDAMREDTVRELILCRFEAGDRAGALLEYRRFEQRLREEMGVAPMVETRALYDHIAQHTGASAERPASTSLPHVADPLEKAAGKGAPGNLPAQLTTFVGREREVAAVRNLLVQSGSHVRLLTLTGPGGCGKTRLALEVASRLAADDPPLFAGGFFFVSLANVSAAALVLPAITEALAIRETANQPLLAALTEYLRPKQILLILDNFEHVTAAAPLLLDLLRAAAGLRIVVTSRMVLRAYGEHEFPVAPLALPDLSDLPGIERIAQYGSVLLFVTRSRAVNPGFVLTADNAPVVAEICVQLDGLPLAIELAAARSKLLTPRALLDRLGDRLNFLTDRSRLRSTGAEVGGSAMHAEERRHTLRATLDWSYHLLTEEERTLFGAVAVFAGGFTLDAVESVCGSLIADVLGGVEALVDNSLLQQYFGDLQGVMSDDSLADEARFRMLATVRDYALEKLERAEFQAELRLTHARYYLDMAEQGERELRGKGQTTWLRRLELENENLRVALRLWNGGDATNHIQALRLAAALGQFWFLSGAYGEAFRELSASLASAAPAPPELRAKALYALGSILHAQGELRGAPVVFAESLALYREVGDPQGTASALYALGRLAARRRNWEEARRLLDESLSLARQTHDEYRAAYVYNILALVATEQGQLDEAQTMYGLALAAARSSENKSGIAFILTSFGELARHQGEFAQAEAYYLEAMGIAQELNQKSRVVMLLHNLGHVALYKQDTAHAEATFRERIRLGMELPDMENFGMCLVGLGGVAAAEMRPEQAAFLFGAGEMVLDTIGAQLLAADRVAYEGYVGRARDQLPYERFEAQRQAGYALTIPNAEAFILSRPGLSPTRK